MTICDRCGQTVRGFNRRWIMGIYPTGAKPVGVVHVRCDAIAPYPAEHWTPSADDRKET
jgi:hypothetical protein